MQRAKRRYKKMNTGETTKKGLYTGVGAGLVLFALIGLLPGSFVGGVIGINIAGAIFGLPLTSAALPRIIVAASMLLGVMLSGLVFISGGAMVGWLTGTAIDALRASKTMTIGHMHTVRIK
jgi:hypothetical protein